MATARSKQGTNKRPRSPLPGYWTLLAGAYSGLAVLWLVTEILRATLARWPGLVLVLWLLAAVSVSGGLVAVLRWWQERQG